MRPRRISRGGLVSLALVLVLAGAAVLSLRAALSSAALRTLVESRLSSALRQPVTIGTLEPAILPRPTIEGRDIRVGSGVAQAVPSISLARVRIVPRLSSLFSRPVVLERVELGGLVVMARRDRNGRWFLPLPAMTETAGQGRGAESGVEVGVIRVRDGSLLVLDDGRPPSAAAGLRQVDADLAVNADGVRLEDFTGHLGRSTVTGHGNTSGGGVRLAIEWRSLVPADFPRVLELLGIEGPAGLVAEGDRPLSLDLTIDPEGGLAATGRMSASKVGFGSLTLTSLAAPVRLAGRRLALEPLSFALYGGQGRGTLRADTMSAPPAWTLTAAIDGVDVNRLLSATNAARDKLSGVGRLRADLRGTTVEPVTRTMSGTMSVEVAGGAVRDFPLLASLNSALRLGTTTSDRDLRFETLTATIRLLNGVMTTDNLEARSGDLTLDAAGSMRFDLGLDLAGTARFTREKSDDLVRRAKDLGGLRNPRGELEVPFTVAGTAASPVFSIQMEKVLQRAAGKELKRQLERQLKKWIRK